MSFAAAFRPPRSLFLATRTSLSLERRRFSVSSIRSRDHSELKIDSGIAQLLERPTWSVRTLLAPAAGDGRTTEAAATASNDGGESGDSGYSITPAQLRHLLRLSALPFPSQASEQKALLDVLRAQLHFVRDIQSVDTSGLQPLQSIRDETREGLEEQTIGVKDVEHALLQEESFGHNRRPRRRKTDSGKTEAEDWDVLRTAVQTAGRYVVVNGVEQ